LNSWGLTAEQEANYEQFVAIKKIFYDRNYVQREVPILMEIANKNKCDNIIRLIDRYLKNNAEDKPFKIRDANQKEYLYIVTDFMPYTICDLNVSPYWYSKQDTLGS